MTSRAPLRAWFTPGILGLHVFWIAAVVVCTIGGFWQMGVYQTRQHDAVDESRTDGVVDVGEVWAAGEPFTTDLQNRTVSVTGHFGDAGDQVWIDGPATDPGVWLVAPFVVSGPDEGAILVVRGEFPGVTDPPEVPEGDVTITVVLQPSQSGATALDAERTTTAITTATLLNELPYRLWSGYGIVTDGVDVPAGADLVPPPDPDVSWTVGLKNLAYAMQWWVFAAFSIFMWWRMVSEQVEQQVGNLNE